MKILTLEESNLSLSELVELAKTETVILTRGGMPLTAVRDLSGSDWESVLLASNPQFLALIERARQAYRERGGVPLADLRRKLG